MNIGTLIVALALSTVQPVAHVQPTDIMNDRTESRGAGTTLLAAGNPWAAPVPDVGRPRDSKQASEPPPVQMTRPRYITPEELKSLEHMPREHQAYGQARQPFRSERLRDGRRYRTPLLGGPGYNNQGIYPFDGGYGYPSYPGTNPLMDPYGATPYGDVPYQGLLPFIY